MSGKKVEQSYTMKHGQEIYLLPARYTCKYGLINAKIKVAVSVDKQRTLIRIYMEKYNSVWR